MAVVTYTSFKDVILNTGDTLTVTTQLGDHSVSTKTPEGQEMLTRLVKDGVVRMTITTSDGTTIPPPITVNIPTNQWVPINVNQTTDPYDYSQKTYPIDPVDNSDRINLDTTIENFGERLTALEEAMDEALTILRLLASEAGL